MASFVFLLLFFLCSVVSVVGFIAAIIFFAMEQRRANMASWTSFAASRGLAFVPPPARLFGPRRARIDGAFEGLAFTIAEHVVRRGKHSHTYTRVHAVAPRPLPGVRISVYQEHAFSALGDLFGFQDVVVGVPEFDARFVVKSEREDDARHLLDAATCGVFLAFPRHFDFSFDGGAVTLAWSGFEVDHATLDAAVRLVIAVCRRC